ncbi:hypothetical protein GLOIN_2v1886063 [Rhizophagus irregularis DAOM 181602=DAOM 197198]|nr:hypothetical protein GLOIN_2v1886063 [Rhizophagus irregularis DAOM 181602=DAOM 197198]
MPLVIQLIYNLHIKTKLLLLENQFCHFNGISRNLLTSAILLSWADVHLKQLSYIFYENDLNVVELPDLPETEQFKKPGRKKNDVWNYFIKEEARKFDHSPSTYSPFSFSYIDELHMVKIIKLVYPKKTKHKVEKVSNMARLHSFYILNAQQELNYLMTLLMK